MFCEECGSQIRQGAKFCQKCGKSVNYSKTNTSQNYIDNHADKQTDIRHSHVITSYSGKTETVGFLGFQIFCLFTLIIFGFVFMLNDNLHRSLFNNLNSSERTFIQVGIWILITVDFFTAIFKIAKAVAINSTSLFITKQGVFGKAAKETYTAVEEFTLSYDDINYVNIQSDLLTLNTNSGNYKMLINNAQNAADSIWDGKNQISSGTSNGFVGFRDNISCDTDTWCCPDCGKQNNNYVGTCGCGYSRKNRQ